MTSPPRFARAKAVTLSVVVPAYNEVDRIAASVSRILAFLDSRPYLSELIVVLDGGRPGADREVVRVAGGRPNVKVLDNGVNRGKGFSVRRGIQASIGEYVVFADADLSLPIEDVERFLDALRAGADIAIGSRMLPESTVSGAQDPFRASLSRLFNGLVRTAIGSDVRDTQCGFKAFVGERAQEIFACQRIDGFGFDVEVLRIAARRGCRIVEVPVRCEYHATSSVRKFRHGLTMLADLARIAAADATGRYGDPR